MIPLEFFRSRTFTGANIDSFMISFLITGVVIFPDPLPAEHPWFFGHPDRSGAPSDGADHDGLFTNLRDAG